MLNLSMILASVLIRILWKNLMMRSIKRYVLINTELRDTTTRRFDLEISYLELHDQMKPMVFKLPSGKNQFGSHKHLEMEPISSKHLIES